MELLLFFAIGWFMGIGYHSHKLQHMIRKQQVQEIKVPMLVAETHGDVIYLFEKGSDTFMCQGKSLEDIAQKLVVNNNIDIAVVYKDKAIYWLVQGKVKEHAE